MARLRYELGLRKGQNPFPDEAHAPARNLVFEVGGDGALGGHPGIVTYLLL
jgi:hypothetical protein